MDVYNSLAEQLVNYDLVDIATAKNIVRFLDDEGLIDYDNLKEYYLYHDDKE